MNNPLFPATRNFIVPAQGRESCRDNDHSSTWKTFTVGGLALFIGVSANNVFAPIIQLCFFTAGIIAALLNRRKIAGTEVLLISIAVLIVLLSRIHSSLEIDGAFRALRPLFEGYLLSYVLYFWCGIRDFRSIVFAVGGFITIQFVFGFAMAVNQEMRTSLLELIYSDESYQNSGFLVALLFRGYGYSRHHLYGLALASGLGSALILIQGGREGHWRTRLLFIALSIFGTILTAANARIGFVPIFVTYIIGLTIIYNSFYSKQLSILTIMVVAPLLSMGTLFGDSFDAVISWLGEGLGQLGGDSPSDSGTFSDLASMVFLPSGFFEFLFGEGRACGINESCYSDIGLVRGAQEGGIVFLGLVCAVYIRLCMHSLALISRSSANIREVRRSRLFFGAVLQLTFIAAMTKGEAFSANDYSRLIATLGFMGMIVRTTRIAGANSEAR